MPPRKLVMNYLLQSVKQIFGLEIIFVRAGELI
ncbi:hypothetical protein MNBD_GAMMA21-29 [hydrothermal vent metagenome]|uniref:Uncharacterized protein n=1 Tax=hydrothermal vent metagenome TaxID=652676 RepID=A0A3B0ZB08_9ZZZZ